MDRFIDITGNRYGKWTVLYRDESKESGHGKDVFWRCRCDCGNTSSIISANLRRGISKSCGCSKTKDITGLRSGKLVALERSVEDGRFWLCQCDCGNKKLIRGSSIIQKSQGSCGCYSTLKDEAGKRFGKLLVLYRIPNAVRVVNGAIVSGTAMWWCRCDCGNEIPTSGGELRGGKKDCGCRYKAGESAFNLLYGSYKKAAKSRGYSWEIDKDFFREITSKPCYYCGKPPAQSALATRKLNGDYFHNGIDRVANNIGYVPNNCVPCCKSCNVAKHIGSVEDFKEWIKSVYHHWAKS